MMSINRVEWYVTVYDSYSKISNKCQIFKLSQSVQTYPVENDNTTQSSPQDACSALLEPALQDQHCRTSKDCPSGKMQWLSPATTTVGLTLILIVQPASSFASLLQSLPAGSLPHGGVSVSTD